MIKEKRFDQVLTRTSMSSVLVRICSQRMPETSVRNASSLKFFISRVLIILWPFSTAPLKTHCQPTSFLLFINIAPTQLHVFLCQKIKVAQLHRFLQHVEITNKIHQKPGLLLVISMCCKNLCSCTTLFSDTEKHVIA